jgi:hypothetical protein
LRGAGTGSGTASITLALVPSRAASMAVIASIPLFELLIRHRLHAAGMLDSHFPWDQ